MPKITELYAYVVEDTGPGDEGVPAFMAGNMPMPMMGADMERAKELRARAQAVADMYGKPLKLIRSTGIEVVETIEPTR